MLEATISEQLSDEEDVCLMWLVIHGDQQSFATSAFMRSDVVRQCANDACFSSVEVPSISTA